MPNFTIHSRFHGWRLVGFAFFSQFVAMGFSVYILGLYLQPLATDFNISPGTLGWGMGIFYLVSSVIAPLLGYWIDKGKARLLMCIGAIMFAAGFLCIGLATEIWQVALACTLLLAPGSSMLGVLPCSGLLVQWFHKRQSFAVGMAAIGISVGGFVMPPLVSALIEMHGWRDSLLILGISIVLVLLPLCWFMVVGRPGDIGQHPDGDQAAGDTELSAAQAVTDVTVTTSLTTKDMISQKVFWLLVGCIGLLSICSIMMVTYIVPYARVNGISTELSALMISLYAGAAIIGKSLLGWLGDLFSKRKIMVLIQIVATVGWSFMLLSKSTAALMASAVFVGFAVGGMTPLWATLIAFHFGPAAFGRVKGIMALAMAVFLIIPGPLGGYLYDTFGSYEAGFRIVWWVLPIALLCAFLLPAKPASQTRQQLEAVT